MLPNLFFLFVSLATGHFTDITDDVPHDVVDYTGPRETYNTNSLLDENDAIDFCKRKCLEAKYFCKVLMVTKVGDWDQFPSYQRFIALPGTFMCLIYGKPISQLSLNYASDCGPLKIYQVSESEQVEPVGERFSHDHHPESQWISDLAKGYGLNFEEDGISKAFFENVIKACPPAMNSKPSTEINQKAISDLVAFSGHKSLEGVKSHSESFANVVFTFLDIFCPHIRTDIKISYDPSETQISIRGPDIDILVVYFGLRDYAIVRDAPNKPAEPLMVYVSNSRRKLEDRYYVEGNSDDEDDIVEDDVSSDDVDGDDHSVVSESISDPVYSDDEYDGHEDNDIVALFQKAMKTTSQYGNVKYILFDYYPGRDNDGQDRTIMILNYVLHSLLEPEKYLHIDPPNAGGLIFYRDLVTAVLSKIYDKADITTFKYRLQTKQYDDLSIITHH